MPDPFVTTCWTRVIAARGDSPEARQALGDLCEAYYAPVVAFLRREDRDDDAARELAHEFFARILKQPSLRAADPQRGRFRSYLLGALKHFLANRRARERREKRGGGVLSEPLVFQTDSAACAALTDVHSPPPDCVFDREWAHHVLERALEMLARECEASGKRLEYETFKPWLANPGRDRLLAEAARALGLNEGAARVAVHRLRRRFRELVKAEIGRTVHDPAEVAGELRHLIEVLSV